MAFSPTVFSLFRYFPPISVCTLNTNVELHESGRLHIAEGELLGWISAFESSAEEIIVFHEMLKPLL